MSSTTSDIKSENGPQGPKPEPQRSFKIVLQRIRDVPYLANFITVAGALLAGFLAAWLWFDSTLNARVERRIAPYENYLNGAALVTDGEYDRAVPELEKAFNMLGKRFDERDSSGENWYPIVDNYLMAIVNSEDPSDHSHRFNKLIRLTDDKFSLNAWQRNQIGWYFLRTGELTKAREHFSKATDMYRVENRYNTASYSYWALALVDLAEGNIESAVGNVQEASKRNSQVFSLEIVITDVKSMREEVWYQRLINLPTFLQRLEQLKSQTDSSKTQ
jgi:tetratricopeptide (TPR) repeat protein